MVRGKLAAILLIGPQFLQGFCHSLCVNGSSRKEKDASSSSTELRTVLSLLLKLLAISCVLARPSTTEECERLADLERLSRYTSRQKSRLRLPVRAELIFLLTMCSLRRFRDLTAYLYRDLAFFLICDTTPLEGRPLSDHIRFQNSALLRSRRTVSFHPSMTLARLLKCGRLC